MGIAGVVLLLQAAGLLSCTKQPALSDKKYHYGKVNVELAKLPGTPDMDLWFDGEKVAELPLIDSKSILAEQSGKLAIYERSTGVLLADTTIMLAKDESRAFKFANSKDYGIKGWISNTPVAGDSICMQLLNNLTVQYYPASSYDLYVCRYDLNTGDFPVVTVLPGFDRGKLMPGRLTLPVYDADGNSIIYVGRLKDPSTGEFVTNPGYGDFFLLSVDDYYKGTYGVYIIHDADGGTIIFNDPVIL